MEAVGAWGGAGVTARARRIRRVPAPARVPGQAALPPSGSPHRKPRPAPSQGVEGPGTRTPL